MNHYTGTGNQPILYIKCPWCGTVALDGDVHVCIRKELVRVSTA